jgi:hypothetical protein
MLLQEATREQLIGELFNRPGFVGVIVFFKDEILTKFPGPKSEVDARYSAVLTPEGACNLLTGAAQQFDDGQ